MYEALADCEDLLLGFGGHAQAAGLSVLPENIPLLRDKLSEIAATKLTAADYIPVLNIEASLPINAVEPRLIEELAALVHLGRRTFERRFKAATHHPVLDYIQRVKMEAAKRKFESSRKNINEVMFDVGYTDTKAFRSVFKRITGLTPVEYRNKYNKMALA